MWVTGLNDRETFSDANDSVIVHFEDGWHDEEEIEELLDIGMPDILLSVKDDVLIIEISKWAKNCVVIDERNEVI